MEGLLETIQLTAGCGYLSDLHKTVNFQKIRTAVSTLLPDAYSLKEWKEAVFYITKKTCECQDVYTAKEILINRIQS